MSNSDELLLGQKRLLERLEQTQERIYTVVSFCIGKLAEEGIEDSDELREILLQQPQRLNESQQRSLGAFLNELLALKYQQQDLVRQIDEYVARSGLLRPDPQPLPKYGCPNPTCIFVKYQLSPQQPMGRCEIHKELQLVRKY